MSSEKEKDSAGATRPPRRGLNPPLGINGAHVGVSHQSPIAGRSRYALCIVSGTLEPEAHRPPQRETAMTSNKKTGIPDPTEVPPPATPVGDLNLRGGRIDIE